MNKPLNVIGDDSVQKLIDLYGLNVLRDYGGSKETSHWIKRAVHDIVALTYQTSCDHCGLGWYEFYHTKRDLEGMLTVFEPEGDRDINRREFLSSFSLKKLDPQFILSAGSGFIFRKVYVCSYIKNGLVLPAEWENLLNEDFFLKIEKQEKRILRTIELSQTKEKVNYLKAKLFPLEGKFKKVLISKLEVLNDKLNKIQFEMEKSMCRSMDRYRSNSLENLMYASISLDSSNRSHYFSIAEKYRSLPILHGNVTEEIQDLFSYSSFKKSFFLGDYHPKNSELGSKCDFSKMILQLKRKNDSAINSFLELFAPLRLDDTVIVGVPSSSLKKISGIKIFANKLGDLIRCNVLSGLLVRVREIPKKSRGGSRNLLQDIDSMELKNAYRFKDKNVLLIDDIITTGTTMQACEEIISQSAEPKSIIRFSLGKTFFTSDLHDSITLPRKFYDISYGSG